MERINNIQKPLLVNNSKNQEVQYEIGMKQQQYLFIKADEVIKDE